jgi:hypothetical protein
MVLVDVGPRGAGPYTQTDEALNNVAPAPAVPKHYRAQPPSDVGVEPVYRKLSASVHGKKKPIHPARYTFRRAMHSSSDCPKFLGVSSRTLSRIRRLLRYESNTSIAPSRGSRRKLKPTKCRFSGRATALLSLFTFSRNRRSMNWTMLAITRCPDRSVHAAILSPPLRARQ